MSTTKQFLKVFSSSSSSILFTKYSNKQKHVTYREYSNMA